MALAPRLRWGSSWAPGADWSQNRRIRQLMSGCGALGGGASRALRGRGKVLAQPPICWREWLRHPLEMAPGALWGPVLPACQGGRAGSCSGPALAPGLSAR